MPRFNDRVLRPRVARAAMAPSSILLAGAGGAVGILAGWGVAGAVGLGVAGWAGRVLYAIPRGQRRTKIDPFALKEPWRAFVRDALQARARFNEAVERTGSGPFHDRLSAIGERIGTGVEEAWRVAQLGQVLVDARRQIDVEAATRELATVRSDADERWAAGSSLAKTADALEAQLASAERMDKVVVDARDRLRLLNARLDEAVARAVELSVRTGDTAGVASLDTDVDALVDEMEALRLALDEAGPTPGLA